MWIVRFALQRPYTFVIVAVLIAIFGGSSIATTPTDILPDINIPIVSVIWTYSGMDADDMSKRIVGVCERALPTSVNNIQYTESQSYSGVGVIKIHFQPNVQIDLAIAQVTALAQSLLRLMPTGILPPYVLKYDASSVPIVQVSLGGQGLSQTQLYDFGQNFIRGQLATIKGAAVPLPYGGEQRSIMVDLEPTQLAAKHLTASDVSAALNNQNLVTASGTEKIGNGDGDVLVLLAAKHRPTQEWMQVLREDFAQKFPEDTFFFEPADITNQTLNFGLPAPIDVQVRGKDAAITAQIAESLQQQIKNVPGAVDVFMQQEVNAPKLNIKVDRLKAQEFALTERDVADNVLLSLSGSGQVAPNFWLDPKTGIEYPVIVQVPQYRLDNLDSLDRTVVTSPTSGVSDQLLRNVSETERQVSPLTVSHYNALPIMDIFANVEQRDLGGVASDVQKIVESNSRHLPAGVQIVLSGQVLTMNTSFSNLEIGIGAAVVFVYLLMAMNFQSWTIPFVILMALPGAFAGIIWVLFLTQTTFNVPSLMGALMTIGVATANSILVVSFANESRGEGETKKDARETALIAGSTRLRPVCMTALAMIIGMFPMALSLGEGGEQNAPIGRAVIGGLLFATVGTLIIVPVIYSLLAKEPLVNWEKRIDDEIGRAQS